MPDLPNSTRPIEKQDVDAVETVEQPSPGAVDDVVEVRRPRRRRLLIFIPVLILIALAGVGAWLWLRHAALHPSTDDAYVQGDTVPISPKIAGRVVEVRVRDQQRVKRGEVVALLDPTDSRIRVDQARAGVAAARARLAQTQAALKQQTRAAAAENAQASAAAAAASARQAQAETSVGLQAGQVETQVQASQAAVSTASTQVETARAQAAAAHASVETASTNVTSSRVAADTARRDWQRFDSLYRQGYVTAQQLDQARAAYDTAAARLRGAQSSLDAARRQEQAAQAQVGVALQQVRQAQSSVSVAAANAPQVAVRQQEAAAAHAQRVQAQAGVAAARAAYDLIEVRRMEVASAQAAVTQAQTQLAAAQRELDETRIVAPSDGVVSQVTGQVGQVVAPDEPLMALVIEGQRWVNANFKETQLTHIQPGQPALIQVDVLGRKTYRGHVESISPATGAQFALLPPENASGNFTKVVQRVPVRVVFDERDPGLQLGLSCEVTVDTTQAPEPVASPLPSPSARPAPRASARPRGTPTR